MLRTMKESRPVKILLTLHIGFQVSGWNCGALEEELRSVI